jgi:hypothetical protein
MRLTPDEVTRVVNRIFAEWKGSAFLAVKGTDDAVKGRLSEIFLAELKLEDDLNRDTEAMLAKYDGEFKSGKLDRHKMYQRVRAQLAKQRKIVL